ncbi:MAG: hypothetical protein PWP24_1912, partial [Clostridiales bacterium]|nr:hypothetical protein [Clostridiales bacterium]
MDALVFTKKDSQIAKGIAILLMVYHHLFAYKRLPQTYVSVIPFISRTDLASIAAFGSICIAIFMLLTGYGLFYSNQTQHSYKKWLFHHLMRFLFHVWLVFFLCNIPNILFIHHSFHLAEWIQNFFFLSTSYNQEWWYVRVYFEILLFSLFFFPWYKKKKIRCVFFSAAGALLGYVVHE